MMTMLMSFNLMAESKIENSMIVNQSVNTGNQTLAVGYHNIASTGAINIRNARVIKSIILNQSDNSGNVTIAYGEKNTGSTGSIIVE